MYNICIKNKDLGSNLNLELSNILQLINGLIDFYFEERMNVCMELLKEKDEICDIKVSDFILEHYKDKRLFVTQNHLTPYFNIWITNQILERLNIPLIPNEYSDTNILESNCVYDNYNVNFYNFSHDTSQIFNNKETKDKISNSMKIAHNEGRAWNIGKSRWNNEPSYPEIFFMEVINNEFTNKMNDPIFRFDVGICEKECHRLLEQKLEFIKNGTKHSLQFWNEDRKKAAASLGFSIPEIINIAAIVEEETNFVPEKSMIASVYINRLRKGIPLQADPTIKYALGNFTLKRITQEHLTAASPFNTYLHTGLPPTPICTPSVSSIEAVLHASNSNKLFFCADPNLNGQHIFAQTLGEHEKNAKNYHDALNKKGIH